ncbi:MAG: hypothetical protein H0V92_09210 [Pseudonocardiales bacterium]|nr:hypothetical protein [Pseudonocardiales bacterium]
MRVLGGGPGGRGGPQPDGTPGRTPSGPSAETCCDYLNVFTDRRQADTWIQAHPRVPGEVLAPTQAEQLDRRIFGDLLEGE